MRPIFQMGKLKPRKGRNCLRLVCKWLPLVSNPGLPPSAASSSLDLVSLRKPSILAGAQARELEGAGAGCGSP